MTVCLLVIVTNAADNEAAAPKSLRQIWAANGDMGDFLGGGFCMILASTPAIVRTALEVEEKIEEKQSRKQGR